MTEQAIIPVDEPDLDALTKKEYGFLSKINEVVVIISTSNPDVAVQAIMEALNCHEDTARKWIRKAEEYLGLGCLEDADSARMMLNLRITQIYAKAMGAVDRDEVKTTRKPFRLKVDGTANGAPVYKVVETAAVTVKRLFDVGALQVAMKAAETLARISGGMPAAAGGATIGNVNIVNANITKESMPGAQTTQDLPVEDLATLVGIEIVEVIDAVESGGERVQPLAADDVQPGPEGEAAGGAEAAGSNGQTRGPDDV